MAQLPQFLNWLINSPTVLSATMLQELVPQVTTPTTDVTGQTGSISTANINQSTLSNGMYRVSGYVEITTVSSLASTLSTTIGWTDDSSTAQIAVSASIAINANNYLAFQLPVRVQAATNVTYSTSLSGAIGSGKYAAHLRLESLG